MENDAWFFIGVFIFIFLIWVATGGPLRPIAISAPAFPKPNLGNGIVLGLPRAPYNVSDPNVPTSPYGPSDNFGGYHGSNGSTDIPVLNGVTFGPPSSYRSLVTLTPYISNASSTPSTESVRLSISQNAAPIDITNWQLVSEATGKSARIPRGTTIPTSGIVNASQDIQLQGGESAIVTSGHSPIGTSFRENKCSGYFETFQDFSPGLPQNCPAPEDEMETYYPYYVRDVSCVNYVQTLSRCEPALFPPRGLSAACKNFLSEHLNYNGCVRSHQDDRDFSGDVWRIFLERDKNLWRGQYEIVKLLDTSGRTVDAFTD
jgi:hypothetical protein